MAMTDYTLTPPAKSSDDEFALAIPLLRPDGYEHRGALLAKALRGRWAPGSRCFYLTRGRAPKWETLYLAGFTARQTSQDRLWRFCAPGSQVALRLDHAMIAARARTMEVA